MTTKFIVCLQVKEALLMNSYFRIFPKTGPPIHGHLNYNPVSQTQARCEFFEWCAWGCGFQGLVCLGTSISTMLMCISFSIVPIISSWGALYFLRYQSPLKAFITSGGPSTFGSAHWVCFCCFYTRSLFCTTNTVFVAPGFSLIKFVGGLAPLPPGHCPGVGKILLIPNHLKWRDIFQYQRPIRMSAPASTNSLHWHLIWDSWHIMAQIFAALLRP